MIPTTHSRRALSLVLLCAAATLSCRAATDPPVWDRHIGALLDSPDSSAALTLPARARVGEPATITVTTAGSGNCTRASGATVEVNGLGAIVTPFDESARTAIACTRDLRPYPRSVELTFYQVGTAQVVVTGARFGTPSGLVSVVDTVVVEP